MKKNITTAYEHNMQVGDWFQVGKKQYRVTKIESATQCKFERIYWYHKKIIQIRVWWIDTVKPFFKNLITVAR